MVLQVRLKSGEAWAVDLTHAQYGWPEVAMSWPRYKAQRIVKQKGEPLSFGDCKERSVAFQADRRLARQVRLCSAFVSATLHQSIHDALETENGTLAILIRDEIADASTIRTKTLDHASETVKDAVKQYHYNNGDEIREANRQLEWVLR